MNELSEELSGYYDFRLLRVLNEEYIYVTMRIRNSSNTKISLKDTFLDQKSAKE